jgi:hypothetical protein
MTIEKDINLPDRLEILKAERKMLEVEVKAALLRKDMKQSLLLTQKLKANNVECRQIYERMELATNL